MNMLAPARSGMCVEVVFDFVCPWCCMGVNRTVSVFDSRQDVDVVYRWRPFLLNPSLTTDGMDFRTYLRALHGTDERIERLLVLIETHARQFDSLIRFDRITRVPATLNAHRLVEWASSRGNCTPLILGIFEAFFRDGSNIAEPVVLADIAERHGFDRDLALHFLSGQTLAGTVTSGQIKAQKAGINGVPSLMIEGLTLTGVHDEPVLHKLMDAALWISGPENNLAIRQQGAGLSSLFQVS
ncbi:DsbA family oxidoreductase [Acetobacter conturbans]|uniref:DSBA-like thioredoxin domain-containing protein n=1 Tax=Acetobacter conturbans TaxID=1737472 RepID=A0ABX0JWH4_9PROT|nr:DsbA family oxidoreductase [Acetobacter conturbans]NHN87644.1 hypothetical protein [Acetobacter conturbans]